MKKKLFILLAVALCGMGVMTSCESISDTATKQTTSYNNATNEFDESSSNATKQTTSYKYTTTYQTVHTGPRGGKYVYTKSGKKRYVSKKKENKQKVKH